MHWVSARVPNSNICSQLQPSSICSQWQLQTDFEFSTELRPSNRTYTLTNNTVTMQGFNMGRYVPPDLEGTTTGNKIHGKKPAGMRGDKQVVRFEMPFNIFCLTCEGHIAQGVRFNAEKKKIGAYYTTPIFSFRMKHTTCGASIEIQTDPKNTAYVVTEGAKKKAIDEEKEAGFIRIVDPAEKPAEDPFAKKEKNVVDRTEAKVGAARIEELKELSERQWGDPYEHSRKIRRVFRVSDGPTRSTYQVPC
jgi:coiled-coil domain-containing protein 130